ncbi:helix-turn-helix domain-containing protein [Streptomyces sp. B8F3]|uniref:helix-turn-helix domain-containing protein n=1 Tax=unclassified Streptomyces TaxID=2593676 RepID=UPI00325DF2FC
MDGQRRFTRPRALGALDGGLAADVKVFAEHLRVLRERVGMTSDALAEALGVDPSRLSRFLSGQSLPQPQMLTRLHRLLADELADEEDGPDAPDVIEAVKGSRTLLYAAARARGPLSARAYEVEELKEKFAEQQTATARELDGLQKELRQERAHRRRAEEQLAEMRAADGRHSYAEQAARLERERDAALRRVAELEDLIAQTGALLRLQERDAQRTEEMAHDTHRELALWEEGFAPAPSSPLTPDMHLDDIVDLLAELRDEDRDAEADGALADIARRWEPQMVAQLYVGLQDAGRHLDGRSLLDAAARLCDGPRLRQLILASAKNKRDLETVLGQTLLPHVGVLTPVSEVLRLAKAFRHRSERDQLQDLAYHAGARPPNELAELRRAGLPAAMWTEELVTEEHTGRWGKTSRKRERTIVHVRGCEKMTDSATTYRRSMKSASAKEKADSDTARWCPSCEARDMAMQQLYLR